MSEAHIRANEVLRRFEGKTSIMGAEIGVLIGQMSECLLRDPRVKLIMVDSWAPEEEQTDAYKASEDYHAHLTAAEQLAHKRVAEEVTEFAGTRRTILHATSREAAGHVPDRSLDFAFIDGDHSFEGCSEDISLWFPKVKVGGYLCGHDYAVPSDAAWAVGVRRAVDAAVKRMGWKLETGPNYVWLVKIEAPIKAAKK